MQGVRMGLLTINRNYKNFRRLIKILTIVGKYGFTHFLSRLEIGPGSAAAKLLKTKREESLDKYSTPKRIRLMLEELGPAFIKMGQLLSLRPDIIPEEYVAELELLQDRNPPVPFEKIEAVIAGDYGDTSGLFSSIEAQPVASGSIAQVHRAVLPEGDTVAVKVLKPGTRRIVETDVSIMRVLARLAYNSFPELRRYDPVGMVQEFSAILMGELNFVREGNMIERFSRFFSDRGTGFIHIPRVYREHTSESVLVMEYIDGIKISETEALRNAGMDLEVIANNGAKIALKEVFEFGFFHADPHPGNLFVLPGNIVAPVDFGITGFIDSEGTRVIGNVLLGLLDRDADRIIHYLKRYDFIDEDTDVRKLKIDLYDIIDMVSDVPIERIDAASSIQALIALTRKHDIRLPGEYFLILKSLFQVDGIGRKLCPDFSVTRAARPFVRKWFADQYKPGRYLKEALILFDELNQFVRDLPMESGTLFRRILKGKLRIPLFHENLDHAVAEIDRIGNRLSFSIIIAALLLASSVIALAKIGPFIRGYSILGLVGFFTAAVMGIWLLVGIIKSGKL